MSDITKYVVGLNKKQILFGITFEQLVLLLYPTFLIPIAYLWYLDLRKRRSTVNAPPGCTKLGMTGRSNTEDEFDTKYDEGTKDTSKWRVKAIFMYPIKSCSPVEVEAADINAEGLTYDRKFAFAEFLKPTTGADRTPRWTFRTLRQPGYEKLALVKVEIWIPKEGAREDKRLLRPQREGSLIVRYPNLPDGFLAPIDRLALRYGLIPKDRSFRVPLTPLDDHSYPQETISIWRDSPVWLNLGQHVPDDFKQWLGVKNPLAIFRADAQSYRQVTKCAPKASEVGYQPVAAFQDVYPLNLLNLASVHDVGKKVGDSIPHLSCRRFRTNFLIEGPAPFDEDDWKRVKFGGHEIACVCRTPRCRLPNVDPATGERHPSEPDKTLKSFRCIDKGDPLNACLGMQLVPLSDQRVRIAVGDQVDVLERGDHFYLKALHPDS